MLLDVANLDIRLRLRAGTLHAVRGVSFQVNAGEVLCIVGESGCGKSLTSLALMNLLPRRAERRADRLALRGTDLTRLSERDLTDVRGDRMAMIFQEPMTSLNPAYTIGRQLEEAFLRHRPASRAAARDRAVYLLEKVGITAARSRLSQYPHQLSGGLRQRVMIAMALMCEPELLIADEPTTALDVTIQAQILRLLNALRAEFNMGVILITHDLGVVAQVADRVAVMYAGQVVESGTVADIFERPMHPYTQALLRCVLVPGGARRSGPLDVIPGTVPSLMGEIHGCAFRSRCRYAIEECADGAVDLRPGGDGNIYRCVLSTQQCIANRTEQ